MHKIIICRGIQGSGKSTFAKAWAMEDPEHRIRINNDDIRNMMGKYWVPSREHLVSILVHQFLLGAMTNCYDIVIDNMNLNPKTVEDIQDTVESWNSGAFGPLSFGNPLPKDTQYEVEFKDFKTPLEECIKRDSLRENPIGGAVIRKTYEKYKNFYGK